MVVAEESHPDKMSLACGYPEISAWSLRKKRATVSGRGRVRRRVTEEKGNRVGRGWKTIDKDI